MRHHNYNLILPYVKKIGDNNIQAPGSGLGLRAFGRPLRGVPGSKFKVQKSLNRKDRQGREEKQVFVGPEGQKDMALQFFAALAFLSERSERAVKKKAVLFDLRASNERERAGGEK